MGGGRPGAGGSGDQQKEMQEKQAAMEDMRNSILSQVLTQEARARRNIFDHLSIVLSNWLEQRLLF